MSLLDQLWDETVAGPRPDNGLGKLRKHHTFSFRPSPGGKESEGGSPEDGGVRVTRSIMIVKPPSTSNQNGSPPVSPAGSTPPVSPFSGIPDGVCISPGGRFPPFANQGKPPRKAVKGPKDLTLCRVFRKKTCCDVAQTHPALFSVRKLALTGEASQECLQLWELLECSICDPHVGIQPGPPLICDSLCDEVYRACSNAYFSMDAKTQVLAPCGVSDFVCGRASEWTSNGTELCRAAGFAVKSSRDMGEASCYGGKASLDSIADSWRTSQSGVPQKAESSGVWEDFQQWAREMPFSERVCWAVGGMVLTAGLFFASKRKSHNQRQKHAAIQRTARKLGSKIDQKSPVARGNRKVNSILADLLIRIGVGVKL